MNGPIPAKTMGFLLLQSHPCPRPPVCGARLLGEERREEKYQTLRGVLTPFKLQLVKYDRKYNFRENKTGKLFLKSHF